MFIIKEKNNHTDCVLKKEEVILHCKSKYYLECTVTKSNRKRGENVYICSKKNDKNRS